MLNWVLIVTMLIPDVLLPVELEMRFSQKRYCTFAMEKVLESQPKFTINGEQVSSVIVDSRCEDQR
jgi:hypothetical protein